MGTEGDPPIAKQAAAIAPCLLCFGDYGRRVVQQRRAAVERRVVSNTPLCLLCLLRLQPLRRTHRATALRRREAASCEHAPYASYAFSPWGGRAVQRRAHLEGRAGGRPIPATLLWVSFPWIVERNAIHERRPHWPGPRRRGRGSGSPRMGARWRGC